MFGLYSGLILLSLEWVETSHQLGDRVYPLARYRIMSILGHIVREGGVKRSVRDVDKPPTSF